MDYKTSYAGHLQGNLSIPGDKSISHRSIILASLAEGDSYIKGFLESEDCINTIKAFQKMGVNICRQAKGSYKIEGIGLDGLKEPADIINCGNSGTTMRLLTGLLSAQDFYSVLSGDHSLSKRPMDRVIKPLLSMGARIWSRKNNYAPISIKGNILTGIEYTLPVASAQVKSALLLAGLYCQGDMKIIEPGKSRDHTERMLKGFGVEIESRDNVIKLVKRDTIRLNKQDITIPGDISSAAYFIAGALIIPDSEIVMKNIGINPSRSGFLEIIEEMGGNIKLYNFRNNSGEPVADIKVSSSSLKAVTIKGEVIPSLIDEIPLLAVLASQAEGVTIIQDAEELRVKESDRIRTTVEGLRKLGVKVEEKRDGMIIKGPCKINGDIEINSYYDHRIAMSFIVAGLISKSPIVIKNSEAINISFPEFQDLLKKVVY